jgi:hypothetical protein
LRFAVVFCGLLAGVSVEADFPNQPWKGAIMELAVWLPALFLLGLGTMGVLFAFVSGCEKV